MVITLPSITTSSTVSAGEDNVAPSNVKLDSTVASSESLNVRIPFAVEPSNDIPPPPLAAIVIAPSALVIVMLLPAVRVPTAGPLVPPISN